MNTIRRSLSRMLAALLATSLILLAAPPLGAWAADDYPYRGQSSGVDPWNYYKGQCTSFVAWRLNNIHGIPFHNRYGGVHFGNASSWGNAAKSIGITVNNTPAVGAVAWKDAYAHGASQYGHVAWVSAVNGNMISIEEYNSATKYSYGTRTLSKDSYSGFIHFKPQAAPDPSPTPAPTPTPRPTPTPAQPSPTPPPSPSIPPPSVPSPNQPGHPGQQQLSEWMRPEDIPPEMEVAERKWTYTTTDTFVSADIIADGASLLDESWVQTGSGSREYAYFPGGFDTSHHIYTAYDKAPVADFETESTKRTVTDSRSSYIYWHWTYEPGSPTSSVNNRYIQSYYGPGVSGYNFVYFHAVVSENDYPFVAGANAYQWNGGGIYWTWWWYRLDLRRSDYIDYAKSYTYSRTQDHESGTYPDETDVSNIQEWVRYFLPQTETPSPQPSPQDIIYEPEPIYDNESEYWPDHEQEYGADDWADYTVEYGTEYDIGARWPSDARPLLFAYPAIGGGAIELQWFDEADDGYYLLRDGGRLNDGAPINSGKYVDASIEAAKQYTYQIINALTEAMSDPLMIMLPHTTSADLFLYDSPDDWAFDEIVVAGMQGLVTTEMTYSYSTDTTRAEFCRIVIRMLDCYAGVDMKLWAREVGYTITTFEDTPDPDIATAAALGIVYGTDAERNLFSPHDALTREQAATMLTRATDYLQCLYDGEQQYDWSDGAAISQWAIYSVNAMHTCGVMNGISTDDLVFSPQGPYTHQQSIATINRLYEYITEIAEPTGSIDTTPSISYG